MSARLKIKRPSWRGRDARRSARNRESRLSDAANSVFVGIVIAPLLAVIGAYCFVADEIPTGRGGVMTGGLKDAAGTIVLAAGIALHIGFAWPHLPGLRRIWIPAPGVTALAAVAGLALSGGANG